MFVLVSVLVLMGFARWFCLRGKASVATAAPIDGEGWVDVFDSLHAPFALPDGFRELPFSEVWDMKLTIPEARVWLSFSGGGTREHITHVVSELAAQSGLLSEKPEQINEVALYSSIVSKRKRYCLMSFDEMQKTPTEDDFDWLLNASSIVRTVFEDELEPETALAADRKSALAAALKKNLTPKQLAE